MITLQRYTSADKTCWDDFVRNAKNGLFMFFRDYMEYHSDRFTDYSLLFWDDDSLLAVLPASLHGQEVRSHGGLTFGGIISGENMKTAKMLECFQLLLTFLREQNITKLVYKAIPYIYTNLPAEEDRYALFINNARHFKVEPSSTILFENRLSLPKGRKAQISRAKREGVNVEQSIDFDQFIALENQVLQKRHNTTAVHTASELRYLQQKFPDNIQLYAGMYQGKMIAATLLFVYKDLVHTQYLASNEVGQRIGALDLVISECINKFKTEKKFFDFGISTEDNGRFLNNGLIFQKESFGGRAVIHETYILEI